MKNITLVATLLVACFWTLSIAGISQQISSSGESMGKIEGKFLNADTKKPVPNIEIELSRADKDVPKSEKEVGKVKTTEEGKYSFDSLKAGKYLMSVTVKYFRAEDAPCRPVGWLVVNANTADGGKVQIAMSNEIAVTASEVVKMNVDLKCR